MCFFSAMTLRIMQCKYNCICLEFICVVHFDCKMPGSHSEVRVLHDMLKRARSNSLIPFYLFVLLPKPQHYFLQ